MRFSGCRRRNAVATSPQTVVRPLCHNSAQRRSLSERRYGHDSTRQIAFAERLSGDGLTGRRSFAERLSGHDSIRKICP